MTITLDVRPEIEADLTATARAHGLSTEQYAQQVLEKALASETARKPLSARIRRIWSDLPEDVRARLPVDGASQHDHYIYGVPKKTE
jgi:plasmid stability protein